MYFATNDRRPTSIECTIQFNNKRSTKIVFYLRHWPGIQNNTIRVTREKKQNFNLLSKFRANNVCREISRHAYGGLATRPNVPAGKRCFGQL